MPVQVSGVVEALGVGVVGRVEEVFDGDAEVPDQGVLHRAGDAGVEVDVLGAEELPQRHAVVGLGDDVVHVLAADAVREVGERAAVVREEEAHIGRAEEDAGPDDARHGAARVEGEFLDDYDQRSVFRYFPAQSRSSVRLFDGVSRANTHRDRCREWAASQCQRDE